MIWLTSDTHFNHEKIIEFCRSEFKDTNEMNEHIIKVWNEIIQPDDTVFHLGDFAFKTGQKKDQVKAIVERLNGKKTLILGNHDNLKHIKDFAFDRILDTLEITHEGVTFKLAHFPYKWSMQDKDIVSRPECFTKHDMSQPILPLLCGHVHESYMIRKNCLNMGWDIWKRPVSIDKVMEVYNATKGFTENLDNVRHLLYT